MVDFADDDKFPTSSRGECEDKDDEYQVYDGDYKYEVEKFMVDGMHFSHGHPLSLAISNEEEDKQQQEMDDDDHNFCRICGLPIFVSTPAYSCTKANNACKFFLHQQCALKVLPIVTHPIHRPDFDRTHFLRIVKRSSTNFMTYECGDCDFEIHPLVAVSGVEIKIKHKSHPSHQMVAVCKENSCECDACGKIQQGFFFACHLCNFWIHQDCTMLPNIITFAVHPHPFILAYSLAPSHIDRRVCLFCHAKLRNRHNGIYFCPQTTYFTHAACGMEKFASSDVMCACLRNKARVDATADDEFDAFPVSVIRRYAESMKPLSLNPHVDNVRHDDDELGIDKYHKHPLILTHQVSSTTTTKACNLACDLCTRPIPTEVSSPLFYKCDDDCHFLSHKICADILPILKFFIPGVESNPARIYPDLSSYMFSSISHCRFCHRPCNGLCYHFPEEDGGEELQLMIDNLPFFFDLECMAAPTTVNHASHAQHILFRTSQMLDGTPLTCCRDDSFYYDVYGCITCEYCIHIRCAMLPKRVVYPQYHHHPLHLVFTTIGGDDEYEESRSFCEVCEEDIDLKYWFYRCSECNQLFHINCIPAVGHLSKVKFGEAFSLPDSHIHPLKLKRMLTLHSQRCGRCKQIIQGLVDQIAFFCSLCYFWLHFSCAAAAHNKNTSNKFMKLYSDFDDDAAIRKLMKK